jgi:hypothetical protein
MTNPDYQHLCRVLTVTSKSFRGVIPGRMETYTAIRPLLTHYLQIITGVDFNQGQQDPVDLFEALLRTFNVGGVFTTKKTVQNFYDNGTMTTTVSTDQMFRHSVYHSVTSGVTKFETLFPGLETLTITQDASKPRKVGEDVLVEQKTLTEFSGGPVLCLTREVLIPDLCPVNYGRWSASTNTCVLPLLNTVKKCVQWYELQAVLCWKGQMSVMGEIGHYVCFVFQEEKSRWWFYNDMAGRNGFTTLQPIDSIESHPEFRPSESGVMFVYALISSPPTDVK